MWGAGVDGFDYLTWAVNFGAADPPDTVNGAADGDFNKDDIVDGFDYLVWAVNFGTGTSETVPEPSALVLLAVGAMGAVVGCRRRTRA